MNYYQHRSPRLQERPCSRLVLMRQRVAEQAHTMETGRAETPPSKTDGVSVSPSVSLIQPTDM